MVKVDLNDAAVPDEAGHGGQGHLSTSSCVSIQQPRPSEDMAASFFITKSAKLKWDGPVFLLHHLLPPALTAVT